MSFELIRFPLTLVIRGPVLTAGEAFVKWGIDKMFYRNWKGEPAIPQSLLRGKLKEALTDLASAGQCDKKDIDTLFGKESMDTPENRGSYEPHRGMIKITDFAFIRDKEVDNNVRARIRINPERLIVEKGALHFSEALFKAGVKTRWQGHLEFFTDKKEKWVNLIKKGICFISSIGAEKTIGFGHLEKVEFGTPYAVICKANSTSCPSGKVA